MDKPPLRIGLVVLAAALTLTAMLLTACGGNGDRTKVEASLQHYLGTINSQACLGSRVCGSGAFPVGAGHAQVKKKSCKKVRTGNWSCVVTFAHGKAALPVAVAVKGSGEVYGAVPMSPGPPPARVYGNGPDTGGDGL